MIRPTQRLIKQKEKRVINSSWSSNGKSSPEIQFLHAEEINKEKWWSSDKYAMYMCDCD